jgi:sugar transferase (PEP-CTERM/EpsH1 system associated)
MKLLIVTADLPRPAWGASARNFHLLKALAHEHSVSLLALVGSAEAEVYGDIRRLQDVARSVQLIPRPMSHSKRRQQLMNIARGQSYLLNLFILQEMQDALDALLARDNYDVVLFESVLLAGYRLPAGIRAIIDQHNIEHELLERTYKQERSPLRKWYNWQEGRLLKQGEIERCRNADVVLVASERERIVLKGLLPENVIEVVPNGVDIETFDGNTSEQEVPNQIIFTGTMDYYPNTNAVLFFAQRCWPLIRAQIPGATWQIVGRNPPVEIRKLGELPGVTVTGTVPDVRPYLAASSVAIAPLRVGSGTRLKILEALAMRKAMVSTSVGYEGLSLVPGKHLIVADRPQEIAQAIVALMNNPEMRAALGTAGRALVEAEYDWGRCGDRLLRILEEREREFVC